MVVEKAGIDKNRIFAWEFQTRERQQSYGTRKQASLFAMQLFGNATEQKIFVKE